MVGLAFIPGLLAGLAAVELSNTITTGSVIVGLLVGAATLIAVAYGARYKVGFQAASAAAHELRKSLADEVARAERLEAKLDETSEINSRLRETVERLSQLEKLEIVIGMMNKNADRADSRSQERLNHGLEEIRSYVDERLVERLVQHEDQALERHEALLILTQRIVDRLDRAA